MRDWLSKNIHCFVSNTFFLCSLTLRNLMFLTDRQSPGKSDTLRTPCASVSDLRATEDAKRVAAQCEPIVQHPFQQNAVPVGNHFCQRYQILARSGTMFPLLLQQRSMRCECISMATQCLQHTSTRLE